MMATYSACRYQKVPSTGLYNTHLKREPDLLREHVLESISLTWREVTTLPSLSQNMTPDETTTTTNGLVSSNIGLVEHMHIEVPSGCTTWKYHGWRKRSISGRTVIVFRMFTSSGSLHLADCDIWMLWDQSCTTTSTV